MLEDSILVEDTNLEYTITTKHKARSLIECAVSQGRGWENIWEYSASSEYHDILLWPVWGLHERPTFAERSIQYQL